MSELMCNGTPHTNTVPATAGNAAAEPPPGHAHDPREALDAVKKATVVALARLGGSRRMAAAEVGCAHRTIARAAARDPQFAAELAAAESQADHKALALIDRATDQEKYWRAAAWMLERRNPEEFGRRASNTMTPNQVLNLFTRFLQSVLPQVPADCRETLLTEYESVLADLTGEDDPEFDKSKLKVKEEKVVEEAPVAAVQKPLLESACPREEPAARQWLATLNFDQVREIKLRAEEKPQRPDWDRWRELVEEAWQRVFQQSCDEYDRERRERRARRAARQQAEAGRCAPPNTQEGCHATNGRASAKPYANGTYDDA